MTRFSAGVRDLPVSNGDAAERVDADHNRALLLSAARTLIAERGADAVPIQAIASEAGVARACSFAGLAAKPR